VEPARNRLSFGYEALPEAERNAARLVFPHPGSRVLYPDWAEVAAATVTGPPADVGRFPDHGRPHQVLCELLDASPEFAGYRAAQDVRRRDHGTRRVMNPRVGELVLTFEAFALPADPHQWLCTYTAPRGSDTERRLRHLATLVTASV
jgi:transcription regulator MmyB-like protein